MLGRFLTAVGSRLLGADLAAILQSSRDSADNIEALLPKPSRHASTCPDCGLTYYWQDTTPEVCDGCGYPDHKTS